MAPKELIAFRIPTEEMAFLKTMAMRYHLKPQDYLRRLVHRNFMRYARRIRKAEGKPDQSTTPG